MAPPLRTFTICVDCQRPMGRLEKKSEKYVRAQSHWPWCGLCFMRRANDPEFEKWLRKHLYA